MLIRLVDYCVDTIVASITTNAVAVDSITAASLSSLKFTGPFYFCKAEGKGRGAIEIR